MVLQNPLNETSFYIAAFLYPNIPVGYDNKLRLCYPNATVNKNSLLLRWKIAECWTEKMCYAIPNNLIIFLQKLQKENG